MRKYPSLSLFLFIFFLGAAPAHASQILSRQVPLESSSSSSISSDLSIQYDARPLAIEAEDSVRKSCLEAVSKGSWQALRCLLWDRKKSDTIVSFYCATEVNEVHMTLAIKKLISDFVCLFEDANKVQYENGVNLLHTACMFLSAQSVSIVALILTLDINVNAQSEYGQTALHYLCQHRYHDTWEKHIVAMVDLIVKKGGSCQIQNNWQENPLHVLCKHRSSVAPLSLDLMKRFAGEKEVMNAVDRFGMTPLHILCDNPPLSSLDPVKSTCIRTLLIDVKRVAYYHAWKRSRCREGVKYLLTHGGQPSLRIQATIAKGKGHTPYALARRVGFRKPFLCCGIVCCNEQICFSSYANDTAKDLLLVVDPLGNSVCPKLSYCCWATRTDTKLIMITWVSVVILFVIGLACMYRE